ncbi:MAG TPA: serine hydrolase domain-containing protein [Planctomycetota bacterium]|nr:serine hydrolase domain-containing protein [Planctomycetota bacterium]
MRTSIAAGLLALLAAPLATSAPDRKAFDDALLHYTTRGFSGSVLIARKGEVLISGGYGFADFAANRPNDANTLFEIASITKSFTATAVVKLAQQGALGLDDSIADRLPGVPAHSRKITLRHLLSHTSGIPRSQGAGRGEDLQQAVIAYLGAGPTSTPGSKYEYWNGGYALLAGVIERASGGSYTAYLERELFAPAGMNDTGFTGDADLGTDRDAVGSAYQGEDRRALEHPYSSYGYQYRGMGGIVTSVADLLKWDRVLADGQLLDADHRKELFEPIQDGYALGWRIARAVNGTPSQSHAGSVRGFVSEFRRYPAEGCCIALLCNRGDQNLGEIADNLESLLFHRPLPIPLPKNEILTSEQSAACAGTFQSSAGSVVIRAAPGVLVAGIEGQKLLDQLGVSEKLAWKADAVELSSRAVEIVQAIAKDDPEPLRKHMTKRIAAGLPETTIRSTWPEQLAAHGAFKSVAAVGSLARRGRLEVLLSLEHERGPAHVLIAFSAEGLELLQWKGPEFLSVARLEPQGRNNFLLPVGPTPCKLDFEFQKGSAVTLRLAGLKFSRE